MTTKFTILRCLLVLCTLGVLVCAAPANAVTAPPQGITTTLGDPLELETFIDSVMAEQMEEQHIAGAQVVIVKDGRILLSKGFGFADIEKGIPVDADQTLFKPGSVSKLFTWTAVMQLVEQGKIDLQADVNTYLTDFQIPAAFSQPITMLDLMAHTSGFEEISWRAGTMDVEDVEKTTPLGDLVAGFMPERVFPPGQVPSYSNYGATLAGYIIELVSGEPYDQYIEQHILEPLGMDHSSMLQELPAELASDLSLSYVFNDTYEPIPFEWMYIRPAGGLMASGTDMGKFMLAHLQDGEYNVGRILQPETARLMHTQSYAFDPALTGSAHGFEELTRNGLRLIGHTGAFNGWMTMLELIPEEQVGFYVSYNTSVSEDVLTSLLQMFMDRYYSAPSASDDLDSSPAGDRPSRYTGVYISSRNNFTTPAKFEGLGQMTWVGSSQDGMLRFAHPRNPLVVDSWVAVRPQVFRNTRTAELAIFKEDEQAQVLYLAVTNDVFRILIKQPWYGYLGLLAFSLLTFLLTIIAAPVGFFISRRKRRAGEGSPRQRQLARGAALGLCLVFFAFALSMYINWMDFDLPVIRILAWVIAVLALCVTSLAAVAWWKGWWGLAGRLHYSVVALAGLAFSGFLAYWKLLMLP